CDKRGPQTNRSRSLRQNTSPPATLLQTAHPVHYPAEDRRTRTKKIKAPRLWICLCLSFAPSRSLMTVAHDSSFDPRPVDEMLIAIFPAPPLLPVKLPFLLSRLGAVALFATPLLFRRLFCIILPSSSSSSSSSRLRFSESRGGGDERAASSV